MLLADALSLLVTPENVSEILQDVRVDGIHVMATENDDYIKLHAIKQETRNTVERINKEPPSDRGKIL